MKQRGDLREETDHLLQACWTLAEMLFSLRQNLREGKRIDEELLVSAVQACWDLCDIFREGWTQVRPDRGTPRPSQVTFSPGTYSMVSKGDQLAWPCTHNHGRDCRSVAQRGVKRKAKKKKKTNMRRTKCSQPP